LKEKAGGGARDRLLLLRRFERPFRDSFVSQYSCLFMLKSEQSLFRSGASEINLDVR
jgi:hypothetical protein